MQIQVSWAGLTFQISRSTKSAASDLFLVRFRLTPECGTHQMLWQTRKIFAHLWKKKRKRKAERYLSAAVLMCIDGYWWVVLWKRNCLFSPSQPQLKGWRTGHKRQTCLGDLLSSRAKVELMSVPDYNDPLRHTKLPSPPRPSTTSISRVRGDSRHMIDVCLWRNQEGAQINFSLSSFDFVWLIYFLTPSTNGQREKRPCLWQ